MLKGSPLTVGHIAYANCEPFFHFLRTSGFNGTVLDGVPAQLNRFLAAGELDLSPSSSFEYLRNWREYQLLPGMSISSDGPVKSVLLFSPYPIESLRGEEIFLTGESASSVHLLQVLLREYFSFDEVLCRVPEEALETYIRQGRPALLIGDRALKTSGEVPREHIYDLGELWCQYSGLPFVFALWIIRRDSVERCGQEVSVFYNQLRNSLALAFEDLSSVARNLPAYSWYGEQQLIEYWQSMSYGLDNRQLQGLLRYAELLVKYGFLSELPEIDFVDLIEGESAR